MRGIGTGIDAEPAGRAIRIADVVRGHAPLRRLAASEHEQERGINSKCRSPTAEQFRERAQADGQNGQNPDNGPSIFGADACDCHPTLLMMLKRARLRG